MSTLRELIVETPHIVARAARARSAIGSESAYSTFRQLTSVREEQIHALVQQLFFRHESAPVRHVGFAPVEASTATATLCLEVAKALAEEDQYDVGLIDATRIPVLLQTQLADSASQPPLTTWPIAPRLWMVPRQSWLADARGQRITDQNLSRLRELTARVRFFDSVVRSGLLAHGEHWPDLRRTGAGADCQQNQTPGRRPNQRAAYARRKFHCWGQFSRNAVFPCRKACTGVCESYGRIDHKSTVGRRHLTICPRSMPA